MAEKKDKKKQRKEEFSLKADRTDVIVPAAKIFLTTTGIVKAEYNTHI